jgi:hypothetical protein
MAPRGLSNNCLLTVHTILFEAFVSGSLVICKGMSEGHLGHSSLDQNGNSCDLTPYGNCLIFCLSEWNSIDSDKN